MTPGQCTHAFAIKELIGMHVVAQVQPGCTDLIAV
jgi:hypothetical protein